LSPAKRAAAPISIVHSAQRTGTDNAPVTVAATAHAGAPGAGSQDYSQMAVPSVWRNARTAAAKVEALSSNGMDEIEIPAFLRKQAD